MKTVKELEKEVNQLKADIEELKQQEIIEWKPEDGEEYYFIDLDLMAVDYSHWEDGESDNIRLNHKVVFKTREEAEEYLQYLIAREKAINKFNQRAWKNSNMKKYYIYQNNSTLNIDFAREYHHFNAPYFWTERDAQEFLNKYEKFIKRDMRICED